MEYSCNKIEERRGIIVIGMISSGKSTFLNSLLGITYLETKDDITTKFVCIIRYNENANEPIFYHLKVVEEKEQFHFIKDGDDVIGKENIIKMISSTNLKEASLSEPKYENLFYMLETNIKNISNKEFLKTHDFYDIPGLNEFIVSQKEEKENKNDKEETKREEEEEIKREE